MTGGVIVYFGFLAEEHGTRWAEVRVVREGGRQVSQTPTGTTYPTFRAASDGVAAKNSAISKGSVTE